MLKTCSLLFGFVFLAVGIMGFVPALTPGGHLLGIFHVNAAHNIVHILSGAVAILVGLAGEHAAKMFFRVFGIIYGMVALFGFLSGDQAVLGLIANNRADAWLHAGIAAASLLLGFAVKEHVVVKSQTSAV